LVGYLVHRT